jgi:protein-S-isoprenylcysteine O-methyltransferase Ste14
MNNGRVDVPSIVAPPPLLFFACLLLGWGLGFVHRFEPFALGFTFRLIAGGALLLIAAALGTAALLVMHRSHTPPEPWKPTVRVVKDGPFRFTRNPLYAGLLLVLSAIAILTASGWLMLSVPVLFVLLDYGVVRAEEHYLSQKFGDEYRLYLKQVRRWI